MMSFARDIIIDNGGVIFGAFVRDSIIHDSNDQKFHEKFKNMTDIIFYNNPKFDPETTNRLMIPQEIDVNITERNYHKFIIEMKQKRFKVVELFCHFARDDFRSILVNDQNMKHIKLSVVIDYDTLNREIDLLPIHGKIRKRLVGVINSPMILVNILRSTRTYADPFISHIDFECNGLFLTKFGISVSSSIHSEFIGILAANQLKERIVNDIISNHVVVITPSDENLLCDEVLSDD